MVGFRRLAPLGAFAAALAVVSCGSSGGGGPPGNPDATAPDAGDTGGTGTDSGNPADTGGLPADASDATPPADSSVDSTGGDDSSAPGDGGDAAASMDAGDAAKDSGTDASGIGPGSADCMMGMPLGATATNDDLLLSPDTTGAAHSIAAPCVTGNAPEVFYSFTLTSPMFVYADTFGSSWSPVLFLLSNTCAPIATPALTGGAVCNAGACGTSQSQIVTVLSSGRYKLGITGQGTDAGVNQGPATVHFRVALAASGSEALLPKGATMQSGTTSGTLSNINGSACVAAGPENGYWWTSCPNDPGGMLSASTCSGVTAWDSVLKLQVPGSIQYMCAEDACMGNLQASITAMIPAGPGLSVLAVGGATVGDMGAYTMSVTRP